MKQTNCPNCGAPMEGVQCPYCGTYFLSIADIDTTKPKYIRLPVNGKTVIFTVIATEIRLEQISYESDIYANDDVTIAVSEPHVKLTVEMDVVKDDDGIYARTMLNG